MPIKAANHGEFSPLSAVLYSYSFE